MSWLAQNIKRLISFVSIIRRRLVARAEVRSALDPGAKALDDSDVNGEASTEQPPVQIVPETVANEGDQAEDAIGNGRPLNVLKPDEEANAESETEGITAGKDEFTDGVIDIDELPAAPETEAEPGEEANAESETEGITAGKDEFTDGVIDIDELPAAPETEAEPNEGEEISDVEPGGRPSVAAGMFDGNEEEFEIEFGSVDLTGEEPSPTSTNSPGTGRRKRYQPPSRKGSKTRSPRSNPKDQSEGEEITPSAALEMEVRVIFEHGGFCQVGLLAKRAEGLPEQLTVSHTSETREFIAICEDWFRDTEIDDISVFLTDGVEFGSVDSARRWLLTGREVYVLGSHPDVRGFVSKPRLALQQEQIVLCTERLLSPVEEILNESGCSGIECLGESDGVPSGWRLLRGLYPERSVPSTEYSEILNVVRPAAEIEINIEGGIRLDYNNWLNGYPPQIRVLGNPENISAVYIDSVRAITTNDEGYQTLGWDNVGEHTVVCDPVTKTYSIVDAPEEWQLCSAYRFPIEIGDTATDETVICGPLVGKSSAERGENWDPTVVPVTNPVLLGAIPGEVFFARASFELIGSGLICWPPFQPVWAVPPDPLRSNKGSVKLMFLGNLHADPNYQRPISDPNNTNKSRNIENWYRLILDSNRKGLSVEPDKTEIDELWRVYVRVARNYWRASK